MTAGLDRGSVPGHAAPQRGTVSLWLLAYGLFGAPSAWALQLISNYALMSHYCYPLQTPRSTPAFGGVRVLSIALSAVFLIVAVGALVVAIRSWTMTRHEASVRKTTAHHEAAEVGEGRTRFLAMSGILVSGIFVFGVLMAGVPLVLMPICVF